jgi:hypothetical protein
VLPIWVLLALFPLTPLVAQTGRIDGTVRHIQTHQPVVGARVSIVGTDLYAITDPTGYYVIPRIPAGVYVVSVHAIGFEATEYTGHDVAMGQSVTVNFELNPTGEGGELQLEQSGGIANIHSGFGMGGSVGLGGMGGMDNGAIGLGGSFEGFLLYGIPAGLSLMVGAQVNKHGIEQTSESYLLFSAFVEPRYSLTGISPHWAPFVTGRVSLMWESVSVRVADFSASGRSLSGGAGVLFRLTDQAALETGVSVGAAVFKDYAFVGELRWKNCLDGLDAGTTLPSSVVECKDSRDGPVVTCYPPYSTGEGRGDCVPPEIPYADSGRSGSVYRMWIGLNLTFSARR